MNNIDKTKEELLKELLELQLENTSLKKDFGKNIFNLKVAEQMLLQNKKKYRNLIDKMPDGVYKSTPEGKFININDSLVKMLGYDSKEELMAIDIKTQLYFEISDRESKALEENKKELGIFRMKKKDGSEIWMEDHGWLNYNQTQNVVYHEGIIRDITERIEAEIMLLESKQQLQLIYDSVSDPLFQIEVQNEDDFIFISMNKSGLEAIGITLEQLSNKNVKEIIPQPSLDLVLGKYHEAIRTGKSVRWEEETEYPNGVKTAIVSISPIFNEKGKCIRLTGSIHDITERKQAEFKLQEKENNYRLLVESANEGILVTQDNNLKFVNAKLMELLGYTEEELLSIPFIELIHPDYRELIVDNYKKRINGEIVSKSYNVRAINKDQTTRWLDFSAVKIEWEGKPATMSFITDISERQRAEEKLQKSNDFIINTLENMTDGYVSLNTDWVYTYVNSYAAQMLGRKPEDLIGKHIWTEFPEGIHQVSYGNYYKAVASQQPIIFEEYYPLWNLWYENKIVPSKEGLAIFFQNITERKQSENTLRESEERHRSLVEWTTDAIVVHRDGKIIYANSAAQNAVTTSHPQDLLGRSIIDFIHPDFHNLMMERSKTIAKIGDTTPLIQAKFIAMDSTVIDVEMQSILVNYNGIPAIQTSIHDITKRKETENLIIKAKEHAEESDRLKSAFLANMSHEIRTPMNGILGFTNLLKEASLTPENQQEYIKIIDQSGARLLNIINDIIDISKIESNQMMVFFSETNVNDIIESIYNFFKPETLAKGIHLNFKNGLSRDKVLINTDGEKLYGILINLVKNAIKFCDKGIIEFGYTLKDNPTNPELEFYVKDSGVGIQKERQHAIFDRFIQADVSDKRAFQGAGLGLSISKAYVEMLGGKIRVESEVGTGSSFYFTIPYTAIQKTKAVPINTVAVKEPENQVKNLKTLIVEDDAISKLLIKKSITKFSRQILTVSTGVEAVEAFRNNPDIDLVMMDINMPEMNGYEATKKIREFNKKVIIIAQTANAFASDKKEAMAAGCNDYISKPININVLKDLLQKYFE